MSMRKYPNFEVKSGRIRTFTLFLVKRLTFQKL
jgi:hypothetical protein